MSSKECLTVKCPFYDQCIALQAINGRRKLAETHRASLQEVADIDANTRRRLADSRRELENALSDFGLRSGAHWFEKAASGEISYEEAQAHADQAEASAEGWHENVNEQIAEMSDRIVENACELFGEDVASEDAAARRVADLSQRTAHAAGVAEEMAGLQQIALEGCHSPSFIRGIVSFLTGREDMPETPNRYGCHNPNLVEAVQVYDGPNGLFDGLPKVDLDGKF